MHGREKHLYSIYRRCSEKHLSFSEVLDIYGFRIIVQRRAGVLPRARRAARPLQADPGQVQGLHRDPQGERLPVAAHHAVRPVRHADRDPDPHAARCTSIAEAGVASHWLYKSSDADALRAAAEDPPVAAERCSRSSRSRATRSSSSSTSRSTSSPTRSTCSRPRARSWRCRAARPPSTSPTRCTPTSATAASRPRSTSELVPLRTELQNGDRVEIITAAHAQAQPGLAQLRRHRQGALAHPPLPEDHAVPGVGAAGRAAAGPGAARRSRRDARRDRRTRTGTSCVRDAGAKSRAGDRSPTSGSASASPRWSPGSCSRSAAPATASEAPLPGSVIIRGSEGMAVQFAHCCRPIPGRPDHRRRSARARAW